GSPVAEPRHVADGQVGRRDGADRRRRVPGPEQPQAQRPGRRPGDGRGRAAAEGDEPGGRAAVGDAPADDVRPAAGAAAGHARRDGAVPGPGPEPDVARHPGAGDGRGHVLHADAAVADRAAGLAARGGTATGGHKV
ncbi:MAG: hypothetical protein AVDCRST_MAG64-527, partial [uncultured Phycisphaerae bacterium]